jgi:uncharacterized protein
MFTMPYLIDGNNLMPALADAGPYVGREGLCRLLQPLVEHGQVVRVVFDGAEPPAGLAAQILQTGVEVIYSGKREADTIILKLVEADFAPKMLTVVSTDREIRRAAERRRCKALTSQEFAQTLLHIQAARIKPKPPKSPEAKGKEKGLNEKQTRDWLKEFGFEE